MAYNVLGSQAVVALTNAGGSTVTDYAGHLVNTGMAITGVAVEVNAPEYETTSHGDTARKFATQRGDWSVELRGLFPKTSRKIANESVISATGGTYTISMAREWSLDFDWGEVEYTNWTDHGAGDDILWKGFRPRNLLKASGEWSGLRLSTPIEAALFGQGDTAPSATFKVSEQGATDNTLAFDVITLSNSFDIPWQADDAQTYRYSFDATGTITAAGASNVFASGTVGAQNWTGTPQETIKIESVTGGPYLQGKCWLKSLRLRAPIAGPIEVTATLRGTGKLTRT